MKLQDKLKLLLKSRGVKPSGLARAMGVSPARIAEWKKGEGPQLATMLRMGLLMACALDVSLDYLADEAAEEMPPPIPSERERQVREIIERKGWEWAYWRLIDGNDKGIPPRIEFLSPTYGEVQEAAKKLADQLESSPKGGPERPATVKMNCPDTEELPKP